MDCRKSFGNFFHIGVVDPSALHEATIHTQNPLRSAGRLAKPVPDPDIEPLATAFGHGAPFAARMRRPFRARPLKRPRYAITDVWRVEGVSHAEMLDRDQHPALLEPLLTGKDLAEELGCVPATIRNYARDNIIPSLRIGGSIRFRKHQIEGLFDAV